MAPVKVKLVILLLTAVSSDALSPLAPVRAAKRVFLRRGGAAPTLPINSQDVADAQRAWGDGIVEIGRVYTAKGDYKAEAVKVLGELYGWGSDLDVLFKPTKAANPAIRLDYDEALSYFVGAASADKPVAEDKGFAIAPCCVEINQTPSRRRRDSWPSDEVVGGRFFDFGAVRTASSDRDAPLSHFLAMTRPTWLGRVARNRHRHAIEQASRRWRGGRRDDSGRPRRKF